jgi:hypothetical protein
MRDLRYIKLLNKKIFCVFVSKGLVGRYRSSRICHSYLLAIQPSPLDSQDAPFNSLSIARIIESPSGPRSTGSLFSDLNCSLTIIFHLLGSLKWFLFI